jgi:hypothetical protein
VGAEISRHKTGKNILNKVFEVSARRYTVGQNEE